MYTPHSAIAFNQSLMKKQLTSNLSLLQRPKVAETLLFLPLCAKARVLLEDKQLGMDEQQDLKDMHTDFGSALFSKWTVLIYHLEGEDPPSPTSSLPHQTIILFNFYMFEVLKLASH